LNNANHYPIIMENWKYLLWGFSDGPTNMTVLGLNMYLNLINYMVNPPTNTITPSIPGFELLYVVLAIISCLYILILIKKSMKKQF